MKQPQRILLRSSAFTLRAFLFVIFSHGALLDANSHNALRSSLLLVKIAAVKSPSVEIATVKQLLTREIRTFRRPCYPSAKRLP
jgi:hypothetical protein